MIPSSPGNLGREAPEQHDTPSGRSNLLFKLGTVLLGPEVFASQHAMAMQETVGPAAHLPKEAHAELPRAREQDLAQALGRISPAPRDESTRIAALRDLAALSSAYRLPVPLLQEAWTALGDARQSESRELQQTFWNQVVPAIVAAQFPQLSTAQRLEALEWVRQARPDAQTLGGRVAMLHALTRQAGAPEPALPRLLARMLATEAPTAGPGIQADLLSLLSRLPLAQPAVTAATTAAAAPAGSASTTTGPTSAPAAPAAPAAASAAAAAAAAAAGTATGGSGTGASGGGWVATVGAEEQEELVRGVCMALEATGSARVLELGLSCLQALLGGGDAPRRCLGQLVGTLCRTLNVEVVARESWQVVRGLLKAAPHETLAALCQLACSPREAQLVRGAVYCLCMASWGAQRLASVPIAPQLVLPYVHRAALHTPHLIVACEVALALRRLVLKFAAQLRLEWDSILALLLDLLRRFPPVASPFSSPAGGGKSRQAETATGGGGGGVQQAPAAQKLQAVLREIVGGLAELEATVPAEHPLQACRPRLLQLLLQGAELLSPERLQGLLPRLAELASPALQENWQEHLRAYLERLVRGERRVAVRQAALDQLRAVLTSCRLLYDEELARVCAPQLEALVLAPQEDAQVQERALALCGEACRQLDLETPAAFAAMLRPLQLVMLAAAPPAPLRHAALRHAVTAFVARFPRAPASHTRALFACLLEALPALPEPALRCEVIACLGGLRATPSHRLALAEGALASAHLACCAARGPSLDLEALADTLLDRLERDPSAEVALHACAALGGMLSCAELLCGLSLAPRLSRLLQAVAPPLDLPACHDVSPPSAPSGRARDRREEVGAAALELLARFVPHTSSLGSELQRALVSAFVVALSHSDLRLVQDAAMRGLAACAADMPKHLLTPRLFPALLSHLDRVLLLRTPGSEQPPLPPQAPIEFLWCAAQCLEARLRRALDGGSAEAQEVVRRACLVCAGACSARRRPSLPALTAACRTLLSWFRLAPGPDLHAELARLLHQEAAAPLQRPADEQLALEVCADWLARFCDTAGLRDRPGGQPGEGPAALEQQDELELLAEALVPAGLAEARTWWVPSGGSGGGGALVTLRRGRLAWSQLILRRASGIASYLFHHLSSAPALLPSVPASAPLLPPPTPTPTPTPTPVSEPPPSPVASAEHHHHHHFSLPRTVSHSEPLLSRLSSAAPAPPAAPSPSPGPAPSSSLPTTVRLVTGGAEEQESAADLSVFYPPLPSFDEVETGAGASAGEGAGEGEGAAAGGAGTAAATGTAMDSTPRLTLAGQLLLHSASSSASSTPPSPPPPPNATSPVPVSQSPLFLPSPPITPVALLPGPPEFPPLPEPSAISRSPAPPPPPPHFSDLETAGPLSLPSTPLAESSIPRARSHPLAAQITSAPPAYASAPSLSPGFSPLLLASAAMRPAPAAHHAAPPHHDSAAAEKAAGCCLPGFVAGSGQAVALRGGEALERALKVLDLAPAWNVHRFGVVYAAPGTRSEEELLRQTHAGSSPCYQGFLRRLGRLRRLRGLGGYVAGLDTRSDQDGAWGLLWRDPLAQLAFHVVSLMPPPSPQDPHATLRKRHLGNDPVVIVFNESGPELPLDLLLPSPFHLFFVIVSPLSRGLYRIELRRRERTQAPAPPASSASPQQASTSAATPSSGPTIPLEVGSWLVAREKALGPLVRLVALQADLQARLLLAQEVSGAPPPTFLDAYERARQIRTIRERFEETRETPTAGKPAPS